MHEGFSAGSRKLKFQGNFVLLNVMNRENGQRERKQVMNNITD